MAVSTSILFYFPALLGALDMRARYVEYRRYKWNVTPTILRMLRRSACQRYAAIAASDNMGESIAAYREMGYRWWNVLPDGTFSRNNIYLRKKFYLNLLGI